MVSSSQVDWSEKAGWGAPAIEPYGKIVLDPSALVFHYGLEVFFLLLPSPLAASHRDFSMMISALRA